MCVKGILLGIIKAMTAFLPIAAGWHPNVPPSLTTEHKHWLMRPGALTAGLRQLGPMNLRVLSEYSQGVPLDEATPMRLNVMRPVWVREVLMSVDGVDCVVARSLTPLLASHGVWQGIRRLQTRPLADMLYTDRAIKRSPFECRRLACAVPFFTTAKNVSSSVNHGALWARRSTFWRYDQPLLVAECFLPAFWEILPSTRQ